MQLAISIEWHGKIGHRLREPVASYNVEHHHRKVVPKFAKALSVGSAETEPRIILKRMLYMQTLCPKLHLVIVLGAKVLLNEQRGTSIFRNFYVTRAKQPERMLIHKLQKPQLRHGTPNINRGQGFVSVEDVRAVALPALRHRVLLNFEGEADEVNTDTIVDELVQTVAA